MNKYCVRFLGLAALSATVLAVQSAAAQGADPVRFCAERPYDQLCSTIPHDIAVDDPSQEDVDNFSWQSFIALNWSINQSETSDTGKMLGDMGPVAWQAMMDPADVFLPKGEKPVWTPGTDVRGCESVDGRRPNMSSAKASESLVEAVQTFGMPEGVEEFLEAGIFQPLIDRHLNYAVYEIRLNRDAFSDIVNVNNRWYDAMEQRKATSLTFTSGAIDGPVGALEIKIAWRVFPPNVKPTVLERYFVAKAPIFVPARHSATEKDLCIEDATLGMVGFHILHKTASRPQWIWSTFEHVDNVTVGPEAPPGLKPTFSDPRCPVDQCPVNEVPPLESYKYIWMTEQDTSGGYARAHRDVANVPTQAVRVDQHDTNAVNDRWHKKLGGSVLRFYELISTQWPTEPTDRPLGKPMPTSLANTTMETYLPQSSCIGCHFGALGVDGTTKSDFSFLLMRACPSDPVEQTRPECQ